MNVCYNEFVLIKLFCNEFDKWFLCFQNVTGMYIVYTKIKTYFKSKLFISSDVFYNFIHVSNVQLYRLTFKLLGPCFFPGDSAFKVVLIMRAGVFCIYLLCSKCCYIWSGISVVLAVQGLFMSWNFAMQDWRGVARSQCWLKNGNPNVTHY